MAVPQLEIRNILRQEWNPANTSYSVTPYIHTGWYGEETEGPQITVTNPDEFGQRIGTDGVTGEPVTRYVGRVVVNCWAGSVEDLADDNNATTPSPNDLAYDFRNEVNRVVKLYYAGTVDGTEQPIEDLQDDRARLVVDDKREEPVYRFEVIVRYVREERPE